MSFNPDECVKSIMKNLNKNKALILENAELRFMVRQLQEELKKTHRGLEAMEKVKLEIKN